MSKNIRCETCGHNWPKGTDGTHSCIQHLRDRVLQLEKVSHEHEARLIWALKFMKCPGDGIMVSQSADGKFSKGIHWTHWFADGLEMLGRYKVDRELLGLSTKEQNKILKERKAKGKV
jgi:hypothetical protein